MKRQALRVVIVLALLALAVPLEGEARSIRAYFNGQEATVENVTLQVNETFTVDLRIVPDGDTIAYVLLTEPGAIGAYRRLGGESFGEFVTVRCDPAQPASLSWELAPGDEWVGGTAPLNIYCELDHPGADAPYASAYFTVVEAAIVTAEAKSQPATAAGSAPELALAALAAAMGMKNYRRRR